MFDLKALEETDLEQVFSGKEIKSQLVQAFLDSRGNRSLWYARLLKALGIKNLDQHLLIALETPRRSVPGSVLLSFCPLSPEEEAASMLMDLAKSEKNPGSYCGCPSSSKPARS